MKNVVLFLSNGVEEIEAIAIVDILRRANIKCDMCSNGEIKIIGAHNIAFDADLTIKEINAEDYDCLVLSGGMGNVISLKEDPRVIEIVKSFDKQNKIIAAICAAPIILNKADVIKGRKITSYPSVKDQLIGCDYQEDIVVEDNNFITSRGPATAMEFALKIAERLAGKDVTDKLREGMLFNLVEKAIKNS